MSWYYANDGSQSGPVEDAGLAGLVAQGIVRDDTLVWREGMANWQPYRVGRGPQPATAPQPQPQSGSAIRYCSSCGQPTQENLLRNIGGSLKCPNCAAGVAAGAGGGASAMSAAPAYSNPATGAAVPYAPPFAGGWHYGGFWIRYLARLIDGIIVAVAGSVVAVPLVLATGAGALATLGADPDPEQVAAAMPALFGAYGFVMLAFLAIGVLYEAYFLGTRAATPGKMLLGLKVIRTDGSPVTTGLGAGRYFARWLSGMVLWIGYIMAAFDLEKRALHDHICGTRVVYVR